MDPTLEGQDSAVSTATFDSPRWREDGPRFSLVASVIAIVAGAAMVALVGIIVSMISIMRASLVVEHSREELATIVRQALSSRAFVWSKVVVLELALLASVWLACRTVGKPLRKRIGLVATGLRPRSSLVLLLGSVVPFALGVAAAWFVTKAIGSSDDRHSDLSRVWHEGSGWESLAWVLLVALLPGFSEEILFRGFLQRGLLQRWGPAAAILVSNALFAIVHGTLAWAALSFPLGLWLGVVAWRTNSIRLAIAAHAGVNGLWNAGMIALHRGLASETALGWAAIGMLAVGAGAFPWAITILRRQPGR